jgi:hypothetical protein
MPAVRGEGDVGGRKDGDEVVFGGMNCSFRWEGAIFIGKDVLLGDRGRGTRFLPPI